MDYRHDIRLTGSITIVLLYLDEAFWIRLLNRNAKPKPTYITPKLPLPTNFLEEMASRDGKEHIWDLGEFKLGTTKQTIIVYREGDKTAQGWGSRQELSMEAYLLMRDVGIAPPIGLAALKAREEQKAGELT